jgi:glycosyltransferase involved in cell wall biosynthesis
MIVGAASVVICTYNRASLLRETLAGLQAMHPPHGCSVEIVVVDNNSSDDTRAAIEECARDGRFPVVMLHEPRQGKSFALNTALAHAGGDILALLDDDVLPAPDWLERIVDDFRNKSDMTFVSGKVLPRWEREPPAELLCREAEDIWGPLALVDYGDDPIEYEPDAGGQRLPIGANLAFSRAALVHIGGWRNDLGKVNNTLISGEDHEIFMRLKRSGLFAGYYDPAITVRHFVPAHRLTRRYFRRWFFWHGKTQALMFDDLHPELDMSEVPRVAGVPRFAFRQGLEQFGRWVRLRIRGNSLTAFIEELHTLEYLGIFYQGIRSSTAAWRGPAAARRSNDERGLERADVPAQARGRAEARGSARLGKAGRV